MRRFRIPLLLSLGLVLGAASFVVAAVAPKGEEHHHALQAHYKNIMEHAKALHHHATTQKAAMNKEVATEHAAEMGRSLEAARKHHARIEEMTKGNKAIEKHHAAIRRHHAKALEHHRALTEELQKEKPSAEKVKVHAAGVHRETKQAAAEHQKMKRKLGVKEPVEPK